MLPEWVYDQLVNIIRIDVKMDPNNNKDLTHNLGFFLDNIRMDFVAEFERAGKHKTFYVDGHDFKLEMVGINPVQFKVTHIEPEPEITFIEELREKSIEVQMREFKDSARRASNAGWTSIKVTTQDYSLILDDLTEKGFKIVNGLEINGCWHPEIRIISWGETKNV